MRIETPFTTLDKDKYDRKKGDTCRVLHQHLQPSNHMHTWQLLLLCLAFS